MLRPSRLIHLPSVDRFVRFYDINNSHMLALAKSQDNLANSTCVQWDIINDCLCDSTMKSDDITLIDTLFIFMNWRINCKSNIVESGNGGYLEITDWLMELHKKLVGISFKKFISLDNNHVLGLNVPTLKDDMDTQIHFMKLGSKERSFNETTFINTVGAFKTLNGHNFEDINEKLEFNDLLSVNDNKSIVSYFNDINNIHSNVKLNLNFEEDVTFRVDLITSLIRMLFTDNVDNILGESLVMAKKCNIGFTDFLSMSPIDSDTFIDLISKSGNEGENDSDQQLTEEYYNSV